ncbi:zinc finger protein 491-like [Topomyia yanbarensis]|uniref:zinc finger protein 491-like n=1 Tax=Topomyia yanbarensis TaxID=2498891 RepID=UPI00273CE617|nr:zinc finger protein 491-like [Topomyia yanbarensis]
METSKATKTASFQHPSDAFWDFRFYSAAKSQNSLHKPMDIVPESCRLCLSANSPTFPIYERLSLAEIVELLQDLLGIQISNSEDYTNVCNECAMKAKLMYNISSEFRNSDKLFRSFLELKRSSQGIPLLDETKEAIEIVTVLPIEAVDDEMGIVISEEPVQEDELDRGTPEVLESELVYSSSGGEIDEDHEEGDNSFQDPDYSSDDEKLSNLKMLTCFICKEFTGIEKLLNVHLKEMHSTLSPYYCDRCLIGMEDLLAINHHYRTHDYPFGCLFCESLFGQEDDLLTHQESCLGYKCPQCSSHFKFLHDLKEHECKASKSSRMFGINTMIGSRRNQGRFIPQACGMCNEDFGKNCRLAQHFEREHGNFQLQLYRCDICPRKFTDLLAARVHRLVHKKSNEMKQRKIPAVERNDCMICSRVFKFNKELLAHVESEHADAGVEFHQCLKCDKKFTSEAKLLKHDYNTHQGKQPQFFCSFCGRVFNKKLGLRDHENIHRGIKEYHCLDCNKDFTYKSTYDRHMQVVHSDTKQFTCEYCHKSFKRKPTLKVHLRLHTGEKPYQCEYCSRRFVDPSSFHKHKQKEHGWKSSH